MEADKLRVRQLLCTYGEMEYYIKFINIETRKVLSSWKNDPSFMQHYDEVKDCIVGSWKIKRQHDSLNEIEIYIYV